MDDINAACPGWSGPQHWRFFEHILRNNTIKDVLMLGVYMGRDLAYLSAIARELHRPIALTGVDLFADVPGADWLPSQSSMTWQQAHGAEPPSIERAMDCLRRAGEWDGVSLVRALAQDFLQGTECGQYDFIYVDTSHDYQTTADVIDLAMPHLRESGVIAGDDFSNQGTWGVKRAVEERFENPAIHSGWIWQVRKNDYQKAVMA